MAIVQRQSGTLRVIQHPVVKDGEGLHSVWQLLPLALSLVVAQALGEPVSRFSNNKGKSYGFPIPREELIPLPGICPQSSPIWGSNHGPVCTDIALQCFKGGFLGKILLSPRSSHTTSAQSNLSRHNTNRIQCCPSWL